MRRGLVCAQILFLAATAARPAPEHMAVDEVRRGMTGYGLTVFEGARVERFPVEVVDVLRNYLPGQDVVLIRCGGRAGPDRFGVAAGMSGSPIYVNGKLLGALAYGWSFTTDALAGVTPIAAMIRDTTRRAERPAERAAAPATDGAIRLRRLASPLLVSGASPRALRSLEERLGPLGLRPVRGASGGHRPGLDEVRLEPGSSCAVDLMRGDVSWTVLGTVTTVDGDRVLAFGHSFFDTGERAWPLSTAWVNATVGSVASSFKLGETGRPVGALVQDRQAGVAGVLGREVPMIPAVVDVANGVTGRRSVLRVEVVRDPFFTTFMLGMLIDQALLSSEAGLGPHRVRVDLRMTIEGRERPVVYRDVLASDGPVSAFGAASMIGRLFGNPFQEVALIGITLDAEVVHDEGTATIRSAEADRPAAAPGETVSVRVTLRPPRGERRVVTIPLRVPESATPGKSLTVRIVGGDDVSPDVAPPDDLEGVIRVIEGFSPSTDLVAEFDVPRVDVTHRGRIVRGVPASALEALLPSTGAAPVAVRQAAERTRVSTDHAVRGYAVLRIAVVEPGR